MARNNFSRTPSPTPPNVPHVAEPFADEKQSLFVAMVTLPRDLNGGGHGPRGESLCCRISYKAGVEMLMFFQFTIRC